MVKSPNARLQAPQPSLNIPTSHEPQHFGQTHLQHDENNGAGACRVAGAAQAVRGTGTMLPLPFLGAMGDGNARNSASDWERDAAPRTDHLANDPASCMIRASANTVAAGARRSAGICLAEQSGCEGPRDRPFGAFPEQAGPTPSMNGASDALHAHQVAPSDAPPARSRLPLTQDTLEIGDLRRPVLRRAKPAHLASSGLQLEADELAHSHSAMRNYNDRHQVVEAVDSQNKNAGACGPAVSALPQMPKHPLRKPLLVRKAALTFIPTGQDAAADLQLPTRDHEHPAGEAASDRAHQADAAEMQSEQGAQECATGQEGRTPADFRHAMLPSGDVDLMVHAQNINSTASSPCKKQQSSGRIQNPDKDPAPKHSVSAMQPLPLQQCCSGEVLGNDNILDGTGTPGNGVEGERPTAAMLCQRQDGKQESRRTKHSRQHQRSDKATLSFNFTCEGVMQYRPDTVARCAATRAQQLCRHQMSIAGFVVNVADNDLRGSVRTQQGAHRFLHLDIWQDAAAIGSQRW
jgi:hypothetical protein